MFSQNFEYFIGKLANINVWFIIHVYVVVIYLVAKHLAKNESIKVTNRELPGFAITASLLYKNLNIIL